MKISDINCSHKPVSETGIQSGDLYMAKRNTDWKLLECNRYENRVVYPKGTAYPFNDYECFRVEE